MEDHDHLSDPHRESPPASQQPPKPPDIVPPLKRPYKTGNFVRNVHGIEFWLNPDCCGLACAVATYLLLGYALFAVNCVATASLTSKEATFYDFFQAILFDFLVFMALVSHTRAMCIDPGTLAVGTATKENIEALNLQPGEAAYKCTKCDSLKPPRSHHCSVCRRCIRKMDHHCPWINNCVGEDNQKFFILFTFYIAALSFQGGATGLYTFYRCVIADWGIKDKQKRFEEFCPSEYSPGLTTVFLALLIVEGTLFFLFTLIMFCTQVSNVMEDSTGIEQLKHERVTWERSSGVSGLKGVFGDKFSYKWLSPFHHSAAYTRNRLKNHRGDNYKYSPLYTV